MRRLVFGLAGALSLACGGALVIMAGHITGWPRLACLPLACVAIALGLAYLAVAATTKD